MLINCFAGCATEDILRAVGLTMKDLFVGSNGHGRPAPSSPIVATYTYRDQHGEVRYRKQRTADKDFWFEKPDGHGGWAKGIQGLTRHVYRRNEIARATELFIAEGEKDADRLWSIGLSATTNDTGAGKWTDSLTAQLAGVTDAWVLEDNDDPGRQHAADVAASCARAGMQARIVRLPGLAVHGDVSDWLDVGHTLADLMAACVESPVIPNDAVRPEAAPPPIVTRPCTLAEVHVEFVRWLGDEYDLDAIDIVLAAAAVERLDGDPLWLLLLSGPGNAKTETVQALSGIGAVCVSTIASEGALLSASPKKERQRDATGGLLRLVGARGILVIKDMTSILSMQTNTRAGVLAALREIYDGQWVRHVGTDGGKTHTWTGRLAVIGACTTAWDTHHSAIATMGDRYALLRMNSHVGRESAGRHAISNTGHEVEMRAALAEAVGGLLSTVDKRTAALMKRTKAACGGREHHGAVPHGRL